MKQMLLWAYLALVSSATAAVLPLKPAVLKEMRRVADWQIIHQSETHYGVENWVNGALMLGMTDLGELIERLSGDCSYTNWVLGCGEGIRYRPAVRSGNISHADDLCVPQAWLRLYQRFGGQKRLEPTKKRLDSILVQPSEVPLDFRKGGKSLERWSWCDALYMAPQTFAQMSIITGDPKYMAFMDAEFKATTDYLYDKEEHLYFRDTRYFPTGDTKRPNLEANGAKIFWGRGNGWVIGGLANLLRILPKDANERPYYEKLYKEMANRLAKLQCKDGYWHASLLDPASFPAPETSATGFVVYGLAWGINAGILDRDTYLPTVTRGWNALVATVNSNGKLGYVQQIGANPQKVTKDMTMAYGVGAFLQAGVQVWLLAPETSEK